MSGKTSTARHLSGLGLSPDLAVGRAFVYKGYTGHYQGGGEGLECRSSAHSLGEGHPQRTAHIGGSRFEDRRGLGVR